MEVILDLIILVGLLVLGVPVPFCFMAAVLFMFILGGYDPMFIMATGFHKQIQWRSWRSFFSS